MRKTIKKSFLTIIAIIMASFSMLIMPFSSPVFAEGDTDLCATDSVPDEIKTAYGCKDRSQPTNKQQLTTTITNILKGIIAASGLLAVIFVVISGVNYMTSSGDSQKVEKAKKTILYAAIGLAISALAFAIVNWTISIIENQAQATDPASFTEPISCESAGYSWTDNKCQRK